MLKEKKNQTPGKQALKAKREGAGQERECPKCE